jgi:type IV pilus assembly protein PilC
MPLYQYRATDASGQMITGRVEAIHETDLVSQLDRLGLTLIRATASKERKRSVKALPAQEVVSLLFQLDMLVRAGVPILNALGDMRNSAETMESKLVTAGLYESVQAGATLSEAMANYPGVFSNVTINMIRSGEVTGQLPDVLNELVRSLKWQDEMQAQTKKLLMYPAFVTVVIGAVVMFLMIYLVPQLVGFLSNMGQKIPLQTRVLIMVSNFFVHYWWVVLITPPALIGIVVTLLRISPKFRLRFDEYTLKAPVIGPVLKKIILARLADTFALMYRTGIPVLEGLGYCQQVSGNMAVQLALSRVIERIATGTSIAESFGMENLFPSLVVRMLQVGETSGALDKSLSNVSYFYTREINESISKVQAMIEPMMTVIMGLILGWILLSVISPIYDTIAKMKT